MFAVFACEKDKNRKLDVPCLDPLSYGRDGEPEPHLLLRRGRVQLFVDKPTAENHLKVSVVSALAESAEWPKQFDFLILECQPPASGGKGE